MPRERILVLLGTAFAALLGSLASVVPASAAQTEAVLYSFCSNSKCTDGIEPLAGLTFDDAGNLYGMTHIGGAYGYGTVFQLTLGVGGKWTENVIYNFCSAPDCTDGAYPFYGSLIFDAAGNLYGTTSAGGTYGAACGGAGCGTVFELTPGVDSVWSEAVLHNFNNDGKDGWQPAAGLTFDAAGNLYGTTSFGGSSKAGACRNIGCGTVFELTLGAAGTWAEKVLHSFCPGDVCAGDGNQPQAGVILGKTGNLYGTTRLGGSRQRPCGQGCGVVFQLIPASNGKWKEKVLHTFTGQDGREPQASLTFDPTGNLYGTTPATVFELIKNDGWAEKVLHRFYKVNDGVTLRSSLIFDVNGNLYSTTFAGGDSGSGTVFRLTPQADGKWTEKILHSFKNNGQDGRSPLAGLIFDSAGNLYGTTAVGGTSG
jgi:uncharacterized repeat protein (TIGR03803 family)